MSNTIADVLDRGLAPANHFRAEVVKPPVRVTQDAPDVSAAGAAFLRKYGLDWTVSTHALKCADGTGEAVPTHRVVKRDDNGQHLGVVKRDWTPVQNADVVSLADAFVAAGAELTRGGSLKGSKGAFVLAKLSASTVDVVPGDAVRLTIALRNSHDGSGSLTGRVVIGRLVCTNGLICDENAGVLFRLLHTKGIGSRLEFAREQVAKSLVRLTGELKKFQALAARRLQTEEIRKYLELVVPNPTDPEAKRAKANRERERDEIMNLIESGKGTEIPGVRGSLWGAYNAVTEWVDHHHDRDAYAGDARTEHLLFGGGSELKAHALTAARSMLRPS